MNKMSRDAGVGTIGLGICILDITYDWFDGFVPFLADLVQKYEVEYARVYRHYIGVSRGMIAQRILRDGCSHLLFLDDDTIPPVGAVDMLLASDKPVVGAWVRQRRKNYYPMIIQEEKEDNSGLVGIINPPSDTLHLIPCHGIHMACTLIKREVLEKIREMHPDESNPWFDGAQFGEDVIFCRRAREAGFTIWCDPRIKCTHLGEKIKVNDETEPILRLLDKAMEEKDGLGN